VTTAFVLSGGASLGASQVGMLQVLDEQGIIPELVVGSSVGAINGAWLAGGGGAEGLAELWRSLGRQDLFPTRALLGLRAFLGRATHYVPDAGLRRVLRKNVTFARLEDAPIPFAVVATEVPSGAEVVLTEGPAIEAILASSALPAVFPPVQIGDRVLIDGGIVNNTPITTAIELGATEVWVLSTGHACALSAPPTTAFAMAIHAVGLMVQRRLVLEVASRDYAVPVHLIPPPCPIDVSPVDFSMTEELIERAATGTRQWLANGRPDAMPLLAPHAHG
jgi:NTE family protein